MAIQPYHGSYTTPSLIPDTLTPVQVFMQHWLPAILHYNRLNQYYCSRTPVNCSVSVWPTGVSREPGLRPRGAGHIRGPQVQENVSVCPHPAPSNFIYIAPLIQKLQYMVLNHTMKINKRD